MNAIMTDDELYAELCNTQESLCETTTKISEVVNALAISTQKYKRLLEENKIEHIEIERNNRNNDDYEQLLLRTLQNFHIMKTEYEESCETYDKAMLIYSTEKYGFKNRISMLKNRLMGM
jgi:hypothetical protein